MHLGTHDMSVLGPMLFSQLLYSRLLHINSYIYVLLCNTTSMNKRHLSMLSVYLHFCVPELHVKLQFWTPRLTISSPVQKCLKLGANYWWNTYSVLATISFPPALTSSSCGCDMHMSVICPCMDHLVPPSIYSVYMSNPLNSCKSH